MENREHLYVEDASIEVREGEGEVSMIVGEAVIFERESHALFGEFVEVIKKGAFDKARMDRVIARTGHDSAVLLGTTMGQTLRLMKDEDALRYEVDIPDTVAGRDTATYIKRKDIGGSSFAFVPDYGTIKWVDRSEEKKLPIREIHDVAILFDVSPVINPAYPSSSTGLREEDADYPVALRELREWRAAQAKEEGRETQKQIDERNAQELNLKAKSDTLIAIHSHNKQKQ